MKPQGPAQDDLLLFQAHFDQLLNEQHPLIKLAKQFDWEHFEQSIGELYCPDNGAPALPMRLMVGLHYLKHAFNESDESVVERWVENPYWQYFCGYTHMQHRLPIHPTSLTRWRQRIGDDKLAELLQYTVDLAVGNKHIQHNELAKVNVDTTVQEKNITFPTDSKLLYKAIIKLVDAAKARGITLRQSYLRVGKRTAIMVGRYAHARQFKRMRRELRRLKTYVGRLIRDITRKAPDVDDALKTLLKQCQKLRDQQQSDKNKIYSMHEVDVQCISKGKAHKRFEFGQKVSVATTNRGNWFVGALLCKGNPYDGHTLAAALEQVQSHIGTPLTDVYVDKGYRGHDYQGDAMVHIAGSRQKATPTQRRRCKRRSAIEPKIGHAKSENRLARCYLKGLEGDAMNVILAAAGANFRKLLRLLPCAVAIRLNHCLAQRQFNRHVWQLMIG